MKRIDRPSELPLVLMNRNHSSPVRCAVLPDSKPGAKVAAIVLWYWIRNEVTLTALGHEPGR
jgi:hypothetical protein